MIDSKMLKKDWRNQMAGIANIAIKVPTEHIEQVLYIQWAYREKLPVFAIPNGGLRNKTVAMRLKLEGTRSGVPDLFLPIAVPPYHGLFIEMKRVNTGKLSPNQRKWKKILEDEGYKVIVAYGAEAAIKATKQYLIGGENEKQ
jgi:hypothetical protein